MNWEMTSAFDKFWICYLCLALVSVFIAMFWADQKKIGFFWGFIALIGTSLLIGLIIIASSPYKAENKQKA